MKPDYRSFTKSEPGSENGIKIIDVSNVNNPSLSGEEFDLQIICLRSWVFADGFEDGTMDSRGSSSPQEAVGHMDGWAMKAETSAAWMG